MTYEIPQALQYEEKIIFGLTFKQLAYVGGAGLLSVVIFKSSLSIFLRVPLIAVFVLLGASLAFLKLDEKIIHRSSYYSKPRALGYLDKKLAQFIEVQNIENDAVTLNDQSQRAILNITPINFALRSPQDQEALIQSFQKFLNSLDFPIQILMRTVNLNLTSYLDYLRTNLAKKVKKRDANLQKMFADYCNFLETYIEENAVQNRLFYLVIPGKTHDDLHDRAHLCRSQLASLGLQATRLQTKQLISLFASFFDGSIEVNADYQSPVTLLEGFQ